MRTPRAADTFGAMFALSLPLVVLAVFFGALAWPLWNRLVLCARVSLGGATVFALAAVEYPGEGTAAVLAHTGDGLAYLVAVAAGACSAVVMIAAIVALRELAD